jgi:hypothetical protein
MARKANFINRPAKWSNYANSNLERTDANHSPCLTGATNRRSLMINSRTQTLLAVRHFPESSTLTYLDRHAALARDKEHSVSRFDHVSLSGTMRRQSVSGLEDPLLERCLRTPIQIRSLERNFPDWLFLFLSAMIFLPISSNNKKKVSV